MLFKKLVNFARQVFFQRAAGPHAPAGAWERALQKNICEQNNNFFINFL